MIVFITSIKHPENSKSYTNVWGLLNNTLNSICNQIDRDFRVIVVCNKALPIANDETEIHKYTEFVEVDFSPVSQTGYEGIRTDRGTKYIIGLTAARKYDPSYIMFFDADDYIGNNISQFVNANPNCNGWIIDKGFTMAGNKLLPRHGIFNCICGTSNILSYKLVMSGINDELTASSTQPEIMSLTDEYYCHFVIGSHKFTDRYFSEKGYPLRRFPYYAAVHLLGTGENHSDFKNYTQKVLNMRYSGHEEWYVLTDELRKYFHIPS